MRNKFSRRGRNIPGKTNSLPQGASRRVKEGRRCCLLRGLFAPAPKRVNRRKASGAVLKEFPSVIPTKSETRRKRLKPGGPNQEHARSQPSTWERWMGILLPAKFPGAKGIGWTERFWVSGDAQRTSKGRASGPSDAGTWARPNWTRPRSPAEFRSARARSPSPELGAPDGQRAGFVPGQLFRACPGFATCRPNTRRPGHPSFLLFRLPAFDEKNNLVFLGCCQVILLYNPAHTQRDFRPKFSFAFPGASFK